MKTDSQVFRLCGNKTPLSVMIATKHSRGKELTWLDTKKKENRALRYCTNQASIFQDEQDDQARLGQIVFIDGALTVSNRQMTLQKFLAHHPDNQDNGGRVFYLMDHEAEAKAEVEAMDIEFNAQELARNMSLEQLTAIMRKLNPIKVDNMYADEIKLDVRVYAKRHPLNFLKLADSTEVETDNNIAMFLSEKLITLRKQNTEVWNNQEDDKTLLFRVPYGENHVSTLTDYLHNDADGVKKYNELLELLSKL